MTALNSMSIEELLVEVQRRHKALTKLLKQKAKLQRQWGAIEDQISALGSDMVPDGKARKVRKVKRVSKAKIIKARPALQAKRPRNKISLMDAVLKVLQPEQALSIPEIIAAVNKAGYVSKSKTFATIIGQTLKNAGDKVIRVKRGMYALNG